MILQFYVFIKRKNVLETCESFHQNVKKDLLLLLCNGRADLLVKKENGQIGIDSFIIIFQENFHHPY